MSGPIPRLFQVWRAAQASGEKKRPVSLSRYSSCLPARALRLDGVLGAFKAQSAEPTRFERSGALAIGCPTWTSACATSFVFAPARPERVTHVLAKSERCIAAWSSASLALLRRSLVCAESGEAKAGGACSVVGFSSIRQSFSGLQSVLCSSSRSQAILASCCRVSCAVLAR